MDREKVARELVKIARELVSAKDPKEELAWGADFLGGQLTAMAKDIRDGEPIASTIPQALRYLRKVEDAIERFARVVHNY